MDNFLRLVQSKLAYKLIDHCILKIEPQDVLQLLSDV